MEQEIDEDNECIVCMSEFPSRILNCKHKFCRICIVKIIKNLNPICPTCRGEITGMISSRKESDDELDVFELLKSNKNIIYRQRIIEHSIRDRNRVSFQRMIVIFTLIFSVVFLFIISSRQQYVPSTNEEKYYYRINYNGDYERFLNSNLYRN